MGNWKSILVWSLLLLPFLGLANIARSQGMSGNRLREPGDRLGGERLLALLDSDWVRAYLGLEGAQVERLRKIVLATEKANVKADAEMELRRIDLREALRADKPDRDEILKKVQEISDLHGEMMKHNVEAILAAKTVLSPEQQKKIFFLIESREASGPGGEAWRSMRARPPQRPDVPPQPVPLHPGEPPVQ